MKTDAPSEVVILESSAVCTVALLSYKLKKVNVSRMAVLKVHYDQRNMYKEQTIRNLLAPPPPRIHVNSPVHLANVAVA